jgi:hypothetical protein
MKHIKFYRAAIVLLMLFAYTGIKAQYNVGINPTGAQPDASAALDVVATDKGLLIPRMTTVQRLAIVNPANGLMVYDTDTMCVFFYQSATVTWYNICDITGAIGPMGPAGPQGPQGDPGPAGPAGACRTGGSYS